MIYAIKDIREKVRYVAEQYDIKEIRIFGSYFDGVPDDDSDVDLIVSYGPGCSGLTRIQFMADMEEHLHKKVDILNIKFLPDFLINMDLNVKERLIYEQ